MELIEAVGDVCFEHPHVAPFDGVVFVPGRDDFTQGGRVGRTTVWYLAIPICLVVYQ